MISSKLTQSVIQIRRSQVPSGTWRSLRRIPWDSSSRRVGTRNDIGVVGFTLIEILIAIVIIGSFGTIVVNIITSAFRGTSKTDTINTVRQNGSYAISQMGRMITYAKSFDGASLDGVSGWACDTGVLYKAVKVTSFDGTTTIFSCEANTITTNGDSLMDAGPTGTVLLSPGTCFFTCSKGNTADSPTIGIKFTLTSKITSGIVEKQASIPFETSIKVRN